MARDNKVRMPSSTAGITQYFDEVKSKFTLRPEYVVALAVIIVILEMLLQLYGHTFFG